MAKLNQMDKLGIDFIVKQYQSGIKNYTDFTTEVGLWASEKYVFEKYLKKTDQILDIGCGTGRTTIPLHQMGYSNIVGIDLTPEMIKEALKLNQQYQLDIPFQVGDARNLAFEDTAFDKVIFSFNGFMSIPDVNNRRQALVEINRVLKGNGLFIFTTHDRDKDEKYFEFWQKEKETWRLSKQNPALYEFGDLITTSKNEERPIFIHIANKPEIEAFLKNGGFEVLETFYRSDRFEESEKVKERSGECRFWIAQKVAS